MIFVAKVGGERKAVLASKLALGTWDPRVRAERHQKMAGEYFEFAKSAILRASEQRSAEETGYVRRVSPAMRSLDFVWPTRRSAA
jgi:hypothetical protein